MMNRWMIVVAVCAGVMYGCPPVLARGSEMLGPPTVARAGARPSYGGAILMAQGPDSLEGEPLEGAAVVGGPDEDAPINPQVPEEGTAEGGPLGDEGVGGGPAEGGPVVGEPAYGQPVQTAPDDAPIGGAALE